MITGDVLAGVKTIAVVGLSDNPEKPSHQVASYLQSKGFRVIPVNPSVENVLGEKAYPDILSVPGDIKIDIVDIFRRSEDVMPHVREAVERGDAKTVWMQEGIENDEAKTYAESHGMQVIMNFCLMKSHKKTSEE